MTSWLQTVSLLGPFCFMPTLQAPTSTAEPGIDQGTCRGAHDVHVYTVSGQRHGIISQQQ